eukprot:363982-Chlamydomonas_euryale.AAC.1
MIVGRGRELHIRQGCWSTAGHPTRGRPTWAIPWAGQQQRAVRVGRPAKPLVEPKLPPTHNGQVTMVDILVEWPEWPNDDVGHSGCQNGQMTMVDIPVARMAE